MPTARDQLRGVRSGSSRSRHGSNHAHLPRRGGEAGIRADGHSAILKRVQVDWRQIRECWVAWHVSPRSSTLRDQTLPQTSNNAQRIWRSVPGEGPERAEVVSACISSRKSASSLFLDDVDRFLRKIHVCFPEADPPEPFRRVLGLSRFEANCQLLVRLGKSVVKQPITRCQGFLKGVVQWDTSLKASRATNET